MLFVLSIFCKTNSGGFGEFTEYILCRPKVEPVVEETHLEKSSFQAADSSVMVYVSSYPMIFPCDYISLL